MHSCHNLATGGDDNLETSIGHGWQKGPRNAPTVLNSVFNEAQFWDGRAPARRNNRFFIALRPEIAGDQAWVQR